MVKRLFRLTLAFIGVALLGLLFFGKNAHITVGELGGFGGLIALAIVFGLTLALSHFLHATLSWPVVVLAILVSLLTGVISGFLPAWRAARMDPVEALRNE